jgi:penicillin amidase
MVLLRVILRVVNILLALVGIAVVFGAWWFFWRPLPQTSGEVTAPVSARVQISRDALGTPHIKAASQEDALFAQGYVTASERLWQMDALRRSAAGDLAEIVGPAALPVDEESRKLRMRRIAETIYGRLNARDRADITAYARGVNYFIDTHRGNLPFEFAALDYTPRPWSVVDTLLLALYMYRDLTTSWPDHLERSELMKHGDPAKVAFLFPVRAGDEIQPGSNAFVVSGAHTAHGHPQLSNDMHLEYSIPGIWFMVAIEAPGLKVAGVALPGAPGVIVGHNERIAWGVTNLHFNVQDLYLERLDDRTGQYEYQGHVEQARLERDLIQVKNHKPVEFRQWVTRHGPVIVNANGEHMALKWTAAEPVPFAMAFVDIDRAHDWKEFTDAVSGFPGPGQNFVYADVDGNIGYHASGKLPIRRGFTGELPVEGASGKNEWDGYIPFDQLPSSYNPASGIIATANQNPFPASYPYTVSGAFASPYRSGQIFSRLRAKGKLTPQDALAIQKDVYSDFEAELAHLLVKAWDKHRAGNDDLKPAVNELRKFNGQMDKDSAAALIIVLADRDVRTAIADNVAAGASSDYINGPKNGGPFNMSYPATLRLLRQRPAGWFADYDAMLLECLRDAVRDGRRLQGNSIDKWRYGKYLTLEIDHPILKQLPLIAGYFDVGPIQMSGGATTVKQTTRRLGPSERFTAVVGDWDKSLLNLPIGESGHPLSKHYRDEWSAYYNGRSFPMQFEKVDVKATMVLVPK